MPGHKFLRINIFCQNDLSQNDNSISYIYIFIIILTLIILTNVFFSVFVIKLFYRANKVTLYSR